MTFIDVGSINNKEINWAYTIRPYKGDSDWLWVERVVGRGAMGRALWFEGDMKVTLSITQYQLRPKQNCDSVVVVYQQTRSRC